MSIASLGMYDNPAIRPAIDHLWQAWRTLFINSSSLSIMPPVNLNRQLPLAEQWSHEDLFLSQTCGYPYITRYRDTVSLVATPRYTHAGCQGHLYSSFIVSARHASSRLEDYQDKILAANSADSLSGLITLEMTLADNSCTEPFFKECLYSRAHANSMSLVAAGTADLCCVDAVSWAFTCQAEPELASQLQIIQQTPLLPALPLVTSIRHSDDFVQNLQQIIQRSPQDAMTKSALDTLGISGFDLVDESQYAIILELYEKVPATLKGRVAHCFSDAHLPG